MFVVFPPRRIARQSTGAAALALLVSVGVEVARVPFSTYAARPSLLFSAYAENLASGVVRFGPTLALFVALSALASVDSLRVWLRRYLIVIEAALALGVCASIYRTLTVYEPFAISAVKLAFLPLFGFVVWACYAARRAPERRDGWARRAVFGLAPPVLALAGSVACQVLNSVLFVEQYPTLHLALVQIANLLLALGIWHLLRRVPPSPRARRLERAGWITIGVAGLGGVLLGAFGLSERARPYFLAHSVLGAAEAAFEPYSTDKERATNPLSDDPRALERFREHSNFPALPRKFELQDYNVLLVMSEATRFDNTSLGNPELNTTPNLRKLADGAFTFSRAHSASSGTLLSLSSILGMTYPSMLPVETWGKAWTGKLHPEAHTAPELFQESGYDTFWISHDYHRCFTMTIRGLEGGFGDRKLIRDRGRRPRATDAVIAEEVIAALHARRRAKKPFFGFVFFVSPHAPYLSHYPNLPRKGALDRYRQEIRYMDEQLGRVLEALESTGLAQRTIVIFAGDHGEEFREHGGRFHKSTVYGESVHVPLVIRVPGVTGRVIPGPTSVIYTFPWLMLHGSPAMRASATRTLEHEIGPMLRETHGAVVVELLGHDRMKSALVYSKQKFIYDFIASRYEVYELDSDPREKEDRFEHAPELAALATERLNAYRAVRSARRRFQLRPDVPDPRRTPAEEKSDEGAADEGEAPTLEVE